MLLLEERGLGRERSPKKEWQHLADERKFYALRERTAGEHGSFRWRGAEEGERVGRVFYARFWKAKWNPAVKAIVWVAAAAAAKSLQSCPTLCDPTDGSPPGSPSPGILQARTLEGVSFPSPIESLINPYGNWDIKKYQTGIRMWGVRLQSLGFWPVWYDCLCRHHTNSLRDNFAGCCTSMVVLVKEIQINHSFPISSKY